jgi:hypothetical protein
MEDLMIALNYEGCRHIEMVVHDVPSAVAFMERTLGAEKTQQDIVKFITGQVLHIDHIYCGGGIFQFCSVITDDQPHQRFIDEKGPCVTNLNYGVVSQPGADQAVLAAGGKILTRYPISLMPYGKWLGPDKTRPESEMGDTVFADTHDVIGFDLEYSESARKDLHKQTFNPAYRKDRPESPDRVERLLRLRVMVRDLEKTVSNAQQMFAAPGRSEFYDRREHPLGLSAKITFAGLELEYCQPTGADSPWQEYLSRFEQGISTVVFSVKDLDAVVDAIPGRDREKARGEPFEPLGPKKGGYRLSSKPITGFDIELLQEEYN